MYYTENITITKQNQTNHTHTQKSYKIFQKKISQLWGLFYWMKIINFDE